jgi:mono/diheme cytochrome c family protein
MKRGLRWVVGVVTFLTVSPATAQQKVDFQRDIRPILSANCFKCHGPDDKNRREELRLDTRDGAFADRSGTYPFVPGKPAKSEVYRRITAAHAAKRMPPPKSGKTLTQQQIELIRTWIEQGAAWSDHWAFVAPVRAPQPMLRQAGWVRTPIDAFILARLEKEGLKPAPEADKVTLLRRLSLDLTGLPPTIKEVDAFLADAAADSYEKQVERLLRSPHYGERWGRHWLDAARYADSDGYEKDKARRVWAFRDWVINALNRDLPYDRFIIDQIAGDLLPNPTQDQRVATGFLRNSMINEEGGIDPEQFRMEAMFDRMDAIGKGVLGLTIQCAQCHSHKFDPLTHQEYYRLFAFLNNCHEADMAVYTPQEQLQRSALFRKIHELEAGLQEAQPDWAQKMALWEETVKKGQPAWQVVRPELDASGGQKHYLLDDGSVLAAGYAPTKHTTDFTVKTDLKDVRAVRLELLNDPNLPLGGPGRSIKGLFALSEFKVDAAPADNPGKKQQMKIAKATADVNPPERELEKIFDDLSKKRRVTGPIENAIDGKNDTAWTIDVGPGRSNVPRKAVFVFEKPLSFPAGTVLTFKLVQMHGGWNSDDNQNNNLGRFRFSVTDQADAVADPVPVHVRTALGVPREKRSKAQVQAVFSYWRMTVAEWQETNDKIEGLWKQHPEGSSQLVLQPREMPRETHLLERGDFLKPRDAVTPGVPAFLHALPKGATPTRLTFARWLADRKSPTTARSAVNRAWQAYFGTGLVSSSEDLGSQAEVPSHPELLDWLAVEFMERGWSLKQLHRLIVTSATYRQSSRATPELLAKDPANRLLARGPRFRVEAEIVRDIALSASGLLNPEIGGPSVFPPAPEFLFQPPVSYGPKVWLREIGKEQYRRAMYTFSYRSVPYPALQTFDAPNGDFSCVRRSRSNTPLQALTTLNEPIFLDCARALALLTLQEGGASDADRLTFAFRRCVARKPSAAESRVLLGLLTRQVQHFSKAGAKPWDLAAADPKKPPKLPEGVTPAQAAAWTALARVLLNLDETITKE